MPNNLSTNSNFHHHPDRAQFTLDVASSLDGSKHVALVDYQVRDGKWYLTHSEVPTALIGQGIGKVLVNHTVSYLKANKIEYVPVCAYIAKVTADVAVI